MVQLLGWTRQAIIFPTWDTLAWPSLLWSYFCKTVRAFPLEKALSGLLRATILLMFFLHILASPVLTLTRLQLWEV